MNQYLLETSYEDEKLLAVKGEPQLKRYLISCIRDEHYGYGGDKVEGIWRWDGDGKTTKLVLTYTGSERDAEDYLYWSYGVWAPDAPEKVEFTFTVTIDGRA